jgi:hypothetical protein
MQRPGFLNGISILKPKVSNLSQWWGQQDPWQRRPQVQSYDPKSGGAGTQIKVQGYNFSQGGIQGVRFQGSGRGGFSYGQQGQISYQVNNDAQLTITVPSGLMGQQRIYLESQTGQIDVGEFFPTEQAEQAASKVIQEKQQALQIDLEAQKKEREALQKERESFQQSQAKFKEEQAALTTKQAEVQKSEADIKSALDAQAQQQAQAQQEMMKKIYMVGGGVAVLFVIMAFVMKKE